MTDDAAWQLAQHICRTQSADLPTTAIESARRDIFDTFGCIIGGSGAPGIDELCGVIGRWGGREESRVCCGERAFRPRKRRCSTPAWATRSTSTIRWTPAALFIPASLYSRQS